VAENGTPFLLVTDPRGSVRLVVNAMTGGIEQEMNYSVWGVVKKDTKAGRQPFGYAGGVYDAGVGLVHFGAREYDAEARRWLQKDPIGFAGGDTNLYAYVGGDPVNYIDPSGHVPWAALGVGAFVLLSPFLVQRSDDAEGLFNAALPLGQPVSKSIPWAGVFLALSMGANFYGENSFPSGKAIPMSKSVEAWPIYLEEKVLNGLELIILG